MSYSEDTSLSWLDLAHIGGYEEETGNKVHPRMNDEDEAVIENPKTDGNDGDMFFNTNAELLEYVKDVCSKNKTK